MITSDGEKAGDRKVKRLPTTVKKYKQTPNFTEENCPEGFLNDHNTAAGVWGRLVIEKGEVEYTIQTNPPEVVTLNKENFGVIEPQQAHRIRPMGKVEFHIEFYK